MEKLNFKQIKNYNKQLNETASLNFVEKFKEFKVLVNNVFEQSAVAKAILEIITNNYTMDEIIQSAKEYMFVPLYNCICYLIMENNCYSDYTNRILKEVEYVFHPDGDISEFLESSLEEICKEQSLMPSFSGSMIEGDTVGPDLYKALAMLSVAANVNDNQRNVEKIIDLFLYLIELTQLSMSTFNSFAFNYVCNYETAFKTQYDTVLFLISAHEYFKNNNITVEYHVDGKVKCTRYNFSYISGVEEFSKLTGKLTISKKGFLLEADSGQSYKIDFLSFSKLVFENSNERSQRLHIKAIDKPNDYNLYPEYMFDDIVLNEEARDLESTKDLHLYGLTDNQIKQITDICSIINDEVDSDYQRKLQDEKDIINHLKKHHKKELVSFIEQFSDELFLSLKCYWILFSYIQQNLFKRKQSDIPRKEFWLEANSKRTQKLTDIIFVDRYDSYLKTDYPEMKLSSFDTQFCDNVLNNFSQLGEYLAPSIETKANNLDFIDPFFIVWEALFEIVIQYYHDYCIETLGFGDFNGYYDRMIDYMFNNDLTSPKDIMAATYYEILENDLDDSVSNIYERILDEIDNREQRSSLSNFAKALNNSTPNTNKKSIFDVDLMSGLEFEQFVADLFERKGYKVKVTKASGDQGIDVIAEKSGTKIGIQAKCYSGTVGNSAIQEAVAGKQFYLCDKAMVITNNYFTPSAIELAAANDVVLWNRDLLSKNMSDLSN